MFSAHTKSEMCVAVMQVFYMFLYVTMQDQQIQKYDFNSQIFSLGYCPTPAEWLAVG